MKDLIFKIKKYTEQEGVAPAFLRFLYLLLTNDVVVGVINFIFPVVIIPMFFLEFDGNDIKIIDIVFSKDFIITAIIYLLFIIITGICSVWAKRYRTTYKSFQMLSKSLVTCFSYWARSLHGVVERLGEDKKISTYKRLYEDHSDYFQRSNKLCEMIYDVIEHTFGIDDHQVTVMHKAYDPKGDFLKMIAFKNKDDMPPGTFKRKFYFEHKDDKDFYHVKAVKSGKRGIKILNNKKMIKENFIFYTKSFDREEKIEQYIGIPIIDNSNNIISLVQIDTLTKDVFGKGREEINYLAQNIFLPLGNVLKIWYNKHLLAKMIKNL